MVNANGYSSVLYDRLEALSLAEVFGEAFPKLRLRSIKSMLDQHGAGSSALQAATACLSIRSGSGSPFHLCSTVRIVLGRRRSALDVNKGWWGWPDGYK